ncbi:MAG: hypothetical protein HY321_11625 [Armatimonadetes bacterium]|nr:hypothetical protein [Armatimonadota bacterium]
MLRGVPGSDLPSEVRQAMRDQTLNALESWLNLDADHARPDFFWLGPTLVAAGGAFIGFVGPNLFYVHAPNMILGAMLVSGGLATLVERIRNRARERERLFSLTTSIVRLFAGNAPKMPWAPVTEPAASVARAAVAPPAPSLRQPAATDAAPAPLPPGIAAPLARARDACAGIGRLAADPAWARTQVPVAEHERRARAQLEALEERARRLAMVEELLAPVQDSSGAPAHLSALSDLYESHCQGLAAAAEVFEQAQASLARALLAVADGAPGTGAPDAALREIGAAFASLAQVLESLGGPPPRVSQAAPRAASLQAFAQTRAHPPGR